MGTIVKSKKTQKLFSELDIKYNPKKRLQYCRTYTKKESYTKNIKEQWRSLADLTVLMLASPFIVIYQLYNAIQSLFSYTLVYTKRNLKEVNNDKQRIQTLK